MEPRPPIVYFSSASENTRRFVDKLDHPATRIPLRRGDTPIHPTAPFILITPSYGGGDPARAVPKQVIRFLNDPAHRGLLRGIITSGNTNFGSAYCCAGPLISRKCQVPELYRFELLGTSRDVANVQRILTERIV